MDGVSNTGAGAAAGSPHHPSAESSSSSSSSSRGVGGGTLRDTDTDTRDGVVLDTGRLWAHGSLLCFVGEFAAAANLALASCHWEVCLDLLAGVSGRPWSGRSEFLWRQLASPQGPSSWASSASPLSSSVLPAGSATSTAGAAALRCDHSSPSFISSLLLTPRISVQELSELAECLASAGRNVFMMMLRHCVVREPDLERAQQLLSLRPPSVTTESALQAIGMFRRALLGEVEGFEILPGGGDFSFL